MEPVRSGTIALATFLAITFAGQGTAGVIQEPMPDPATRESLPGKATPDASAPAPKVIYSSEGSDSSPAIPGKPLRMGKKPANADLPLYLDALSEGWDRLNAGAYSKALSSFEQAAKSRDKDVSREALMGEGYALWRLNREKEAEEVFRKLVDFGFRVPEILPNLLFLLHKRGGPKAVEPYLELLPEGDRDIWRK